MDPMQLAQAVIVALAPILIKGGEEFAKKAGEAAFAQAKTLWALLRGRTQADPASAAALSKLEAEPQAPTRQTDAGQALGELLAGDDALRQEVERALAQLRSALPSSFSVNVHGGQVDQIVQVDHVAGDLNIGRRDT
jgi:hypothetical protein